MNFENIRRAQELAQQKELGNSFEKQEIEQFHFNNTFIDKHIKNVQSCSDASYAQVSIGALTTIGFLLAHAGIKNSSLYFCDLSDSGTGKTHNFTLQYNLLLQFISKLQDNLQGTCEIDDGSKRFHNIHRGKITVAALNQCIETVPTQLLVIDELGLLMSRGNDIIDEVTKLYGVNQTSLSVTKGKAPNESNIVPVSFSFMGATTLSYFGGAKAVMKEVLGGFINRQLLTYNNILKTSDEITSIFKDTLDYEDSNQKAMQLFEFAKTCSIDKFKYSQASESMQLQFKKEVQELKVMYHNDGTEFGNFYSRVEQNLQMILNILHTLHCYEKNYWSDTIDDNITAKGINFFKKVVFKEIEKLIVYLSDGELLQRQEKQMQKIGTFVQEYQNIHGKMPKIRDISQKTRLNKEQILNLAKDFLELVPGTTTLRYCHSNY